jgi:hypothetical protein
VATIGKIIVSVEGESAAFSKSAKAVNGDLDKMDAQARKAGHGVNSLKAQLDKLKHASGRGSTLDELAKTLRGAGAVAGLTLIGEGLKNATGQAAELSAQFRKGEIDATGMGVKIAESIPVLGAFVSAGQNIREMFTHEKEEIDSINATAQLGNGIMEARVKLVQDVRKEVAELGRT